MLYSLPFPESKDWFIPVLVLSTEETVEVIPFPIATALVSAETMFCPPERKSVGRKLARSTTPAFTMRGWLASVFWVAFLPLPLWSYQIETKPLPLPTKASSAVWSKSPAAVNPMSCVVLSLLLLTRMALPEYPSPTLRSE